MMLKAVALPLVLILCFGGGFVALTKPFNLRGTIAVFAIALAVFLFGYTSGAPKWIALIAMVVALFAFPILRARR